MYSEFGDEQLLKDGQDILRLIPRANCDANFIRSTTKAFPRKTSLINQFGLPIGAVVHPFASASEKANQIQYIKFGNIPPVRCRSCKTYINPFCIFVKNGERWLCNVCRTLNNTPKDYYCELDPNTGLRTDVHLHPELINGSIDIDAPEEYQTRTPLPASFCFVIDVSQVAVNSGMMRVVTSTIANKVDLLAYGSGSQSNVSVITFNSRNVTIYRIEPDKAVVSDQLTTQDKDKEQGNTRPEQYLPSKAHAFVLTDPINIEGTLPMSENFFFSILRSTRYTLVDLLRNVIPIQAERDVQCGLEQGSKDGGSTAGTAIALAFKIMKRNQGSSINIFLASRPTVGLGILPDRVEGKILGTDKEYELLDSPDEYYKKLAVDLIEYRSSVNIFAFPYSYLDIATIGILSKFSGGCVKSYPHFLEIDPLQDAQRLKGDIDHLFRCVHMHDAVVRVRTSPGLLGKLYYGHFFMESSNLLSLAGMLGDNAFAVEFAIENKEIERHVTEVYIQIATLATTKKGQRKIRVHNLRMPVADDISDLFASIDISAIVAMQAKVSAQNAPQTKLSELRTRMDTSLAKSKAAHEVIVLERMRQGRPYSDFIEDVIQDGTKDSNNPNKDRIVDQKEDLKEQKKEQESQISNQPYQPLPAQDTFWDSLNQVAFGQSLNQTTSETQIEKQQQQPIQPHQPQPQQLQQQLQQQQQSRIRSKNIYPNPEFPMNADSWFLPLSLYILALQKSLLLSSAGSKNQSSVSTFTVQSIINVKPEAGLDTKGIISGEQQLGGLLLTNREVLPDERAACAYSLFTMRVPQLIAYLYPCMFALHTLRPDDCTFQSIPLTDTQKQMKKSPSFSELREKRFKWPVSINLHSSNITQNGIYFIENGQSVFIFICHDASKELIDSLFIPTGAVLQDRIRKTLLAKTVVEERGINATKEAETAAIFAARSEKNEQSDDDDDEDSQKELDDTTEKPSDEQRKKNHENISDFRHALANRFLVESVNVVDSRRNNRFPKYQLAPETHSNIAALLGLGPGLISTPGQPLPPIGNIQFPPGMTLPHPFPPGMPGMPFPMVAPRFPMAPILPSVKLLPESNTLYVNNLNEKIKETKMKEQLHEIFGRYGAIIQIVCRKGLIHRGQAFVIFKQSIEATLALNELQNFILFDKPLRINYAQNKSYSILIAEGVDVEPLRAAAKAKSKKIRRILKRDPKAKPNDIKARLSGAQAGNVDEKRGSTAAPVVAPVAPTAHLVTRVGQPNKILYVQNLPQDRTLIMMQNLFGAIVGLKEVRLIEGRPDIAFVEYVDEIQASMALNTYQNYNISDTNKLVISYAKK
ncbi:MAG: putative Protein transport protein SEC24 [Streblomastix strix]|uniref:RRM domain-containing protein n=1 Tax=Streblomastix strix TaxID=222440 RepID=A0A5J4W3H2_9EUKA|nr:MAG: putative Protein transport protein SEC24 [Streblomastix strix]